MNVETMLRDEIGRLRTIESGLMAMFDRFEGRIRCRRVATTIVMMIDSADRHLVDLERVCRDEDWPADLPWVPCVESWREEAEAQILERPMGEDVDALGVALLRRALHLKIPCYESARLFAFYAERPRVAQTLRHALEDEQDSLERLRSAAELGVSLRAVLNGL